MDTIEEYKRKTPASNCFEYLGSYTRFILFWAFKIPWLSMTFSMTFLSFPWPMLSCCFLSIVKTIYYLRHFPTLWRIKCAQVFIFTEWKSVFWLVCYFCNFWSFCPFILRKQIAFPWLSMTHTWTPWLSRPGKWNYKIPWLSRFSMTRTNPVLKKVKKPCLKKTKKDSRQSAPKP